MTTEVLARIDRACAFHGAQGAVLDALRAARSEIVRLTALISEPPTEDEREALRNAVAPHVYDGAGGGVGGEEFTEIVDEIVTAVTASAPWRNRHRGPISENSIFVEVTLDREFEQGNEMEGEKSSWYAEATSARVVDGRLSEPVSSLAAPYAEELDYDGVVQAAISQWVRAQTSVADAEAAR